MLYMKFFSALLLLSLLPLQNQAQAQTTVRLRKADHRATGFFVRTDNNLPISRYIATNFHFCSHNYESDMVSGKTAIGNRFSVEESGLEPTTAVVVAEDRFNDLCILKAEVHKSAFRLGNFLGADSLNSHYILIDSEHKILGFHAFGKDRKQDRYTRYHEQSYVGVTGARPGMSGSPIINSNGEVIFIFWGVNLKNTEGYAISVEALKTLIGGMSAD